MAHSAVILKVEIARGLASGLLIRYQNYYYVGCFMQLEVIASIGEGLVHTFGCLFAHFLLLSNYFREAGKEEEKMNSPGMFYDWLAKAPGVWRVNLAG